MGGTVDSTANVVEKTALGACLIPLLQSLSWHGSQRQLIESMPHYSQIYNSAMFCDVMDNLGYSNQSIRTDINELDKRLLPCLFVSETGLVMVVLRKEKDHYVVFDGEKNSQTTYPIGKGAPSLPGVAYIFKKRSLRDKRLTIEEGWLRRTFLENKKIIYSALIISFFLNILVLATPLFIMATYNKVIGASSGKMLSQFVVGVGFAFAGYYILYQIRAKLLAVVGARFDCAIGDNIFERLLYLAPAYTEGASVGSQVARIKDFDRLREFLTGPMIIVFFDLPFIFIALILIAVIGGNLAIIPSLMIVAFLIIGMFIRLKVRRRIAESGLCGSYQQEFLLESVRNVRALKYLSAEEKWQERFRENSAAVSIAGFKVTILNAITSAIADVIMIGSGVAVLAFGAIKVIDETLSIGGMIAVMILIWRVLAPLKTLFTTLPRLQQVESSIRQIGRLMSIKPESEPADVKVLRRRMQGNIVFNRVSFRYRATYDPALMGLTFRIKSGETVGIVGRSGSGKSTLLKILLGLYQPQAGSVRIDNQDIRQLNPIELRNSIAYLAQIPELFYGTIAANLRLASPNATDDDLRNAADQAGILNEVLNLPKGFDTPIRDYSSAKLAGSFRQSLCLARAYLKNASILLLDEPGTMLDEAADQKLLRTLDELHGKVTVLMVTHRPSHLKKMDKILLLEQGQLILQGPPEEALPKIPKELL